LLVKMGGRPTSLVVRGYPGQNSRSGRLGHCLGRFLVQLELAPLNTRRCRESLLEWSSRHRAIAGVTCRTHASSDGVFRSRMVASELSRSPRLVASRCFFFVSRVVLLFPVIENVGTGAVRHRCSRVELHCAVSIGLLTGPRVA